MNTEPKEREVEGPGSAASSPSRIVCVGVIRKWITSGGCMSKAAAWFNAAVSNLLSVSVAAVRRLPKDKARLLAWLKETSLGKWFRGENYVSLFIVGFFSLATLLAAVFVAFIGSVPVGGWSLSSLLFGSKGASHQPAEEWSFIGDMLQAVVGIPVALAGSLVAVLLAHRAYSISKKQVLYEELNYYEPVIRDAVAIYSKQQTLLGQILRIGTTMIHHIELGIGQKGQDENLIHIVAQLQRRIQEFEKNVSDMSRNPLCRSIWETAGHRRQTITQRAMSSYNVPDHKQWKFFDSGNFTSILSAFEKRRAQEVTFDKYRFHPKNLERVCCFFIRIVCNEDRDIILHKVEKYCQEHSISAVKGYLRFTQEGHSKEKRVIHPREILYYLLPDAEFNLGYALACELVYRLPEPELLKDAITAMLRGRERNNPQIVEDLVRLTVDYGLLTFSEVELAWMAEEFAMWDSRPVLNRFHTIIHDDPQSDYDTSTLKELEALFLDIEYPSQVSNRVEAR
jgi:hypothetical protein